MSAFCKLDCLLHLDPVKTIMAEKTTIFDLPDAIEKIVGNLVERNPPVLYVAAVALCDHRFDTANNHQSGDRRIEKSDINNLQDRDKRERDKKQDYKTNPRQAFPRFPRHQLNSGVRSCRRGDSEAPFLIATKYMLFGRLDPIQNESIPIGHGRPIVPPR